MKTLLQAMFLQVPVIAVNSGGPKETVLHGHTGFLCEQVKHRLFCSENADQMNHFCFHSVFILERWRVWHGHAKIVAKRSHHTIVNKQFHCFHGATGQNTCAGNPRFTVEFRVNLVRSHHDDSKIIMFSRFADEFFFSEHEDEAWRDIGASSKAAVTMFGLIIHFGFYNIF